MHQIIIVFAIVLIVFKTENIKINLNFKKINFYFEKN